MRIVVDLDGTICGRKRPGQTYEEIVPLPEAAGTLRRWRREGRTIIIYTARNVGADTCRADTAAIEIKKMTLAWLRYNNIPYDEIVFGKPLGDIYIDSLGYRFHDWTEARAAINQLSSSKRRCEGDYRP